EHHNMATTEHSNVSLQQHTSPTVDTISLISLTSVQIEIKANLPQQPDRKNYLSNNKEDCYVSALAYTNSKDGVASE
ncbi:unnamed protein product, partial [Sphenostylis stenocarpa]